MVVFDVAVNGKRVAGLLGCGEFGMVRAEVFWHRIQTNAGPIHEDIRLNFMGLEPSEKHKNLEWPLEMLKVGDQVTITIVDSEDYDQPTEPAHLMK